MKFLQARLYVVSVYRPTNHGMVLSAGTQITSIALIVSTLILIDEGPSGLVLEAKRGGLPVTYFRPLLWGGAGCAALLALLAGTYFYAATLPPDVTFFKLTLDLAITLGLIFGAFTLYDSMCDRREAKAIDKELRHYFCPVRKEAARKWLAANRKSERHAKRLVVVPWLMLPVIVINLALFLWQIFLFLWLNGL